MKEVSLESYGPVISDKEIGEEIYAILKKELNSHQQISINMASVISMATYCAKQIFGRLYLELGPQESFEKISIKNATDDVKVIIRFGIENNLKTKKI